MPDFQSGDKGSIPFGRKGFIMAGSSEGERRTVNAIVAGSIPALPEFFKGGMEICQNLKISMIY